MAAGVALTLWGFQSKRLARKLLGIAFTVLAAAALCSCWGWVAFPSWAWACPPFCPLYFDIFSGFIQAFVFCLLSMVYISSACPPPAQERDEAAA